MEMSEEVGVRIVPQLFCPKVCFLCQFDKCLLQIDVACNVRTKEGRRKKEEGRRRTGVEGDSFFITNYPDMI
ncbi:MAG: hypothetical protein F6K24_05685 [Okeania sp. SIO2D1]|nr:hypothetical protein [Okeania sp. SIO2D1]